MTDPPEPGEAAKGGGGLLEQMRKKAAGSGLSTYDGLAIADAAEQAESERDALQRRVEELGRACASYKLSAKAEQEDAAPLRDIMVAVRKLVDAEVGPYDPPPPGRFADVVAALRAFDKHEASPTRSARAEARSDGEGQCGVVPGVPGGIDKRECVLPKGHPGAHEWHGPLPPQPPQPPQPEQALPVLPMQVPAPGVSPVHHVRLEPPQPREVEPSLSEGCEEGTRMPAQPPQPGLFGPTEALGLPTLGGPYGSAKAELAQAWRSYEWERDGVKHEFPSATCLLWHAVNSLIRVLEIRDRAAVEKLDRGTAGQTK